MKKIGVLGAWHVHTGDYVRTTREEGSHELKLLWDHDAKRGQAAAERLELEFVEDLDDFLANVDAVICCTETMLHDDLLLQVAQAGKAIFTEKTLSATKEGAEALAKAIQRTGQPFVISFPQLQFAKHQRLSQELAKGSLGKVSQVRSRNAHNGLSAGWLPDDWMDVDKAGGGALMDLGCHQIYLSLHCFGRPQAVTAFFDIPRERRDDAAATVVLSYDDGPIVTLETSLVSYASPYLLEVFGDQGTYMVRNDDVVMNVSEEWETIDVGANDKAPITLFLEALSGEDVDLSLFGLEQAIALSEILEAAYASHQTGKTVMLS